MVFTPRLPNLLEKRNLDSFKILIYKWDKKKKVGNNSNQIGLLLKVWAFGSKPTRKGETKELSEKSHSGGRY